MGPVPLHGRFRAAGQAQARRAPAEVRSGAAERALPGTQVVSHAAGECAPRTLWVRAASLTAAPPTRSSTVLAIAQAGTDDAPVAASSP